MSDSKTSSELESQLNNPLKEPSKYQLNLSEIIFIALMSAANVIIDLILSPGLKLLFTHLIAGIFIMVPINFLLMFLTKSIADKPGTLTMYLIIFGVLSIPTTMFGSVAGPYKILVGLIIGIGLDLVFLPKNMYLKLLFGTILGSII
jgi:ABC-type thiamin/hydroxymethylpyrimidine transport system permease subunit